MEENKQMEEKMILSCGQNILNWYSFDEKCRVLEIGGDLGQVTQAFINKNCNITTFEPNKEKAKNLIEKFINYEKIRIVNDISQINEKYDYITLIGTVARSKELYYNSSNLYEFIKVLSDRLEDNGKFLIAVDNKYGLRFFAGNPDNITNKKFQSIIGYSNESENVESFTKSSIEKNLKNMGYSTNFYYPLPDYRIPNVIFSDEEIPTYNQIGKYEPYYKDNSTIIIDEPSAMKEILKENKEMFSFFANSFLVEVSKTKIPITFKYVSFNNMRKEEYRLITKISDQYVEKEPVNFLARKHYENIKNNIRILKEENIKILDYEKDGIIQSKYTDQKFMLDKIILNELSKNNYDEVNKLFEKYINELKKNTYHLDSFNDTVFDKYKVIVENPELIKQMNFAKNGMWDMIFSNCFYIDNEFYFFDQEWNEKNLPIEYILYRTIMYTDGLKQLIKTEELFEKYGINQYMDIFKQLDEKIQKKIRNEKIWEFYSQDKRIDIDETKQEMINLNTRNEAIQKALDNVTLEYEEYKKKVQSNIAYKIYKKFKGFSNKN